MTPVAFPQHGQGVVQNRSYVPLLPMQAPYGSPSMAQPGLSGFGSARGPVGSARAPVGPLVMPPSTQVQSSGPMLSPRAGLGGGQRMQQHTGIQAFPVTTRERNVAAREEKLAESAFAKMEEWRVERKALDDKSAALSSHELELHRREIELKQHEDQLHRNQEQQDLREDELRLEGEQLDEKMAALVEEQEKLRKWQDMLRQEHDKLKEEKIRLEEGMRTAGHPFRPHAGNRSYKQTSALERELKEQRLSTKSIKHSEGADIPGSQHSPRLSNESMQSENVEP